LHRLPGIKEHTGSLVGFDVRAFGIHCHQLTAAMLQHLADRHMQRLVMAVMYRLAVALQEGHHGAAD
jgi:hypothetical protein